jgi:iron complex transport system permease protein
VIGRWLGLGLILACVLGVGLSAFIGSTWIEPSRIGAALFGGGSAGDNVIVWQIRLPRAFAAFAVGAALGISGAALQGLLRNPLAEPGVLGVSAMSALGATFVLYWGLVFAAWVVPVAAILGALAATGLIALAAIWTRSVVTLILIGVGLSSFAGAVMALLMNFAPSPFALSDMVNWMLGSVANRSLNDLALSGPFMLAGGLILWLSRRGLSALTLGEDAAASLGVDLQRQRILVVLGAGLATGGAVALAGAIGFVGIIAPHVVRPFVRHDPARVLVPSALLGGLILVLADLVIRTVSTTTELKLGVVAALIGAPAFIWIAMQRRTGE